MLNWESEIKKTWQFTLPVPLASLSISSCTPGAAAMHFLAGHGAQIDQKPELVVGVELPKGHELGFVFFFHEEAAHFTPNVPTFDAVVVYHVGRAVYPDADFLYVREDVFPNLLPPRRTTP